MIYSIYKEKYQSNACNQALNGFENKVVTESRFGTLSEVKISDKSEILEIKHPKFDAKVSTFGGQVLAWAPKPYGPILWSSKSSPIDGSKAIRGGIPVCWPWFGPHNGAGQHGFARNHKWMLKDVKFEEDFVELKLAFFGHDYSKVWPSPFKIVQVLRLSDTLTQHFTYTNIDTSNTAFSQAMHNYFCVSSPANVRLPDLNGVWFDDKITQQQGCAPEELKSMEGPLDRVYHHDNTVTLIDTGFKRAIEISKYNSAQWIIWNPGEDIASTMDDLHQGGEQEFVCVEAGNTGWIDVAPDQSASFGQTIKVFNL